MKHGECVLTRTTHVSIKETSSSLSKNFKSLSSLNFAFCPISFKTQIPFLDNFNEQPTELAFCETLFRNWSITLLESGSRLYQKKKKKMCKILLETTCWQNKSSKLEPSVKMVLTV